MLIYQYYDKIKCKKKIIKPDEFYFVNLINSNSVILNRIWNN